MVFYYARDTKQLLQYTRQFIVSQVHRLRVLMLRDITITKYMPIKNFLDNQHVHVTDKIMHIHVCTNKEHEKSFSKHNTVTVDGKEHVSYIVQISNS